MKIDLTQKITDIDGAVKDDGKQCYVLEANKKDFVKDGKGNLLMYTVDEGKNPLTLKRVMIRSLVGDFPLEPGGSITGDEKAERGELFYRLTQVNGEIELKLEDIVIIQKVIRASEGTLTSHQACRMLDCEEKPSKKKKK